MRTGPSGTSRTPSLARAAAVALPLLIALIACGGAGVRPAMPPPEYEEPEGAVAPPASASAAGAASGAPASSVSPPPRGP